MKKMLLKTKELNKIYGSGEQAVQAVNNVDVEINEGEFITIMGPSGCGKTTLLALMAGLTLPTSGEVFFDSSTLTALSSKEQLKVRKKYMGFVFQENNLLPYLTAFQNVTLTCRLSNRLNQETKERALELLSDFGLSKRLNNLPGQLSGGERQRVAIARALCHQPKIIFLDEPTSRLDSTLSHNLIEQLALNLKKKGKTAVMVTHDVNLTSYADRMVKMLDGKVYME